MNGLGVFFAAILVHVFCKYFSEGYKALLNQVIGLTSITSSVSNSHYRLLLILMLVLGVLHCPVDESLELDHTMAMFGNEIAVGETITGQVSFALEEGQVAKKLIYKPGEEQLAEWDVKSE